MKKFLLAMTAVSLTVPATVIPTTSAEAAYKTWRGKDGRIYCRKKNGTTGLIVGGAGGALLGKAVLGGTVGTIAGAAGGALLGRKIDRDNSSRRCR